MKKKLAILSICSALSFSLLAGFPVNKAKATSEKEHYIVAYKGKIPDSFSETISKVGGAVERVIPEIGIVEVGWR